MLVGTYWEMLRKFLPFSFTQNGSILNLLLEYTASMGKGEEIPPLFPFNGDGGDDDGRLTVD